MPNTAPPRFTKRYDSVTERKAVGATYTPESMAGFVADSMLKNWDIPAKGPIKIFDPAIGEGELIKALLERLPRSRKILVGGFDNNESALDVAKIRLQDIHPKAELNLTCGDFLKHACDDRHEVLLDGLFPNELDQYDLVIANPPYVRTQILGASSAQALASRFGLRGRVDLYHAFILAMTLILKPRGISGIIVSNRFMTTKSGQDVRSAIKSKFHLKHVWDLGDTKLFDAAVLPAILVAEGKNGQTQEDVSFTSVYESKESPTRSAPDIMQSLEDPGIVEIPDGRCYKVSRGRLKDDGVWRIETEENDLWLKTVDSHTWDTFRRIGKIKVGVKTCADRVFVKKDWDSLPNDQKPELLKPLITHHEARQFRSNPPKDLRHILYPHTVVNGRKAAVELDNFPKTKAYLEAHKETLSGRKYVIEAGRNWYEIWVPQDPSAWAKPKIVFRDISEKPCFWLDLKGGVVNGDCYWLAPSSEGNDDLIWLALSVANSTFIEEFYDHRFNNKLYAGRRRFMTQYVENFPLPDPESEISRKIIIAAKKLYERLKNGDENALVEEINLLVWKAFGLSPKKV
jgi:tRNA1(Val) A37 N6-methylase TrmN6